MTTGEAITLDLAVSNGLHLLPQALFLPTGRLKDPSDLRDLLKDQRARLDSSTRSMLATNRNDSRLQSWRDLETRATPDPGDEAWFEHHFLVRPESAEEVRRLLLRRNATNLHWFIDSDGAPWRDLRRLLALMRLESSVSLSTAQDLASPRPTE